MYKARYSSWTHSFSTNCLRLNIFFNFAVIRLTFVVKCLILPRGIVRQQHFCWLVGWLVWWIFALSLDGLFSGNVSQSVTWTYFSLSDLEKWLKMIFDVYKLFLTFCRTLEVIFFLKSLCVMLFWRHFSVFVFGVSLRPSQIHF